MRGSLIKCLGAANRVAKRCLGVQVEPSPPPAAPFYLDAADQPPAYADQATPGTCVFVLQYVTRGAGGLADVLHLGEELRRQHGLEVRYLVMGGQSIEHCRDGIRWTLPEVRAHHVMVSLDFTPDMLCATAWPTAYFVLAHPSHRKLYFVQDYEPWFHRAGVAQYYAAQTYRLGFEMFTLGPWLARQVAEGQGAPCRAHMPFPCTDVPESGTPLRNRRCVTLYIQPDKPQRGNELLIEAARQLARTLDPATELVIFGSEENRYTKPDFPCRVEGVLSEAELRNLLRATRVGVCASFSNLSLMTFRFLAHGCLTLDLDLPNVTLTVPGAARPLFRPCLPAVGALRDAVRAALREDIDDAARSGVAAALTAGHTWPVCADAVGALFADRAKAEEGKRPCKH